MEAHIDLFCCSYYALHVYSFPFYQCFRQSIDLYSSVPSPSIGFLGTPTLSRLGSSFLSSSLTRRHTPETLPTVTKPLLDEQQQQQRRSSHSLLPPIPRRPSIRKGEKASKVSHELPLSRQCSYGQSLLNGKLPPTTKKKAKEEK